MKTDMFLFFFLDGSPCLGWSLHTSNDLFPICLIRLSVSPIEYPV